MLKIVIAGTGYVGLVTAVCLAEIGHKVTCIDIDLKKVKMMQEGISPIYEPGLDEIMAKNMERLVFTTDYVSTYRNADVIFIGVGTPEKKDGSANLCYVNEVALQIAESLEQDCIVVVKSTVPIGTNDKIERLIKENLIHNVHVEVVSNPEFLSQGTAIHDTMLATRIVLGTESKHAEQVLRKVYDKFNIPFVVTDRRSAEMIKYASNDFLALKISYINEIANLCEIVGANIEDVAEGMGMDTRIGNRFLNAGIGYGGSCFPKDTKALHWLANYHDYELKTVKAAIEVNENQKIKPIKKAKKYFESFRDLNVAVLGLAFKPGTDDLREAPSLMSIPIMVEEGANIKAWDPAASENFRRIYPDQITYCKSIDEALTNSDICLIFTEWPEVKNLNVSCFSCLMKTPLVIDGRNCYDLKVIGKERIIYESIGRETVFNISVQNHNSVQDNGNKRLIQYLKHKGGIEVGA